jgi:hypothetical protein
MRALPASAKEIERAMELVAALGGAMKRRI